MNLQDLPIMKALAQIISGGVDKKDANKIAANFSQLSLADKVKINSSHDELMKFLKDQHQIMARGGFIEH